VDGVNYHHFPCRSYFTARKRPQADCNYIAIGKMVNKNSRLSLFKAKDLSLWTPMQKTFSLAEMRFHMKKKVRAFFIKHVPEKRVRAFLMTLATGEAEDLLTPHFFRRLGLSHLLVISGFHFALLASVFYLVLIRLMPKQTAAFFMLGFMMAYELYLGPSPSSERASIAIYVYILGIMLCRRPAAMNTVCLGMFIQLIKNPQLATNIGFQLSYGATFGIILFYRPCESKFCLLLPKRNIQEARQASLLTQHLFLLCGLLRKQFALTLSVNLVVIPLLIFHFRMFSLWSFIYNLPITPLISLCFMLLPFIAIPNINYFVTFIIKIIASFTLNLIFYAPSIDLLIRTAQLSVDWILIYFTLLLFAGLYYQRKRQENILNYW
jgi:competence protein ComEC